MMVSTLANDPLEAVANALGETPGFFQPYTPKHEGLTESLVTRAEAAGDKGIVVTLDTWVTGWRPRDLNAGNFPQLRGHVLANYFSDPVFRSLLARPPEDDPAAAVMTWAATFGRVLPWDDRSEEHTSELPSLMRLSYAFFCLNKTKDTHYCLPTLLL